MYLGKRVGGWLWLALLGGATGTGVAAEPKRAEVGAELVLPLGSLPERVCWYQDQKYSLGPGSSRATAGWSAPAKRAGEQRATGLARAAKGVGCGKARRRRAVPSASVSEAFLDPAKDMDVTSIA